MTRLDSMIVYNPNRDIMEDRPAISDYSIKQMSGVLTRTRLLLSMLEFIISSDNFIFYFYYPRFSYFMWIMFQLIIYFFNAQYLLTYILILLIFMVLQFSAPWERRLTPVLKTIFFNDNLLHPCLMMNNNILTKDHIDQVKNINQLLEASGETDDTVAQTKMAYNIKSKGMMDTYKEAKKGTALTLQWMEVICDFAEKARNLVRWEDPNMTFLFLLLLIVLFLFVTFLPLRLILFFSTFQKFFKGRGWQAKRIRNN